jgi:hypothetical protein
MTVECLIGWSASAVMVSALQAAIHELQGHIQEAEPAWTATPPGKIHPSSDRNSTVSKKQLQSGSLSPERRKGQPSDQAEWKPLHSKPLVKGLQKGKSSAY